MFCGSGCSGSVVDDAACYYSSDAVHGSRDEFVTAATATTTATSN